jgi:hypothetical protein
MAKWITIAAKCVRKPRFDGRNLRYVILDCEGRRGDFESSRYFSQISIARVLKDMNVEVTALASGRGSHAAKEPR